MFNFFKNLLKIQQGFDRLVFLFLGFIIVVHLISCLWIFIPQIYDPDADLGESSWSGDLPDDDYNTYLISVYWTVTTITTVGYGDISGYN